MEQKKKYWLQWGKRIAKPGDELAICVWLMIQRREMKWQK